MISKAEKAAENVQRYNASKLGLALSKQTAGWSILDQLGRGVTIVYGLPTLEAVREYLNKYKEAAE